MDYSYTKKAKDDFNKAPLRRVIGFAIGLIIILFLFFLSPNDKGHMTFYTMFFSLVILYIFLLNKDILHILKVKKQKFHDLAIRINSKNISFIYENCQSSYRLSNVLKVKLFYKKDNLKSISLYFKDKNLIVLNDNFDKLEIMLTELIDIIGKAKFSKSKFFHQYN